MAAGLCAGDLHLFVDNQAPVGTTEPPETLQMLQADVPARPLIIAHNTDSIAEVEEAAKLGADVVEADVWYVDRRLVVAHTLAVGDLLNADTLGRHIDFGEWLGAVPTDMGVMVDVKGGDQGTAAAVSAILSASGAGRPAVLCSRVWSHVLAAQAQENLVGMFSIGVATEWMDVIPLLAIARKPAISISKDALSTEIVAMARDLGAIVYVWTINTLADAIAMSKMGVSGIVTDNILDVGHALR